jgi:hypothetical protein
VSKQLVVSSLGILVLAGTGAASGGSQPKQAGEGNDWSSSGTGTSDAPATDADQPPPAPKKDEGAGDLNDDQKEQIKVALRRGGVGAADCINSVPGAKTTGEGEVQVTFDGKIGKAVEASVGPPFAGSEMEACIKRAFVGQYGLTFDGAPLTVPYTVKIEKKGGAAPSDPKKPDPKKPAGKK